MRSAGLGQILKARESPLRMKLLMRIPKCRSDNACAYELIHRPLQYLITLELKEPEGLCSENPELKEPSCHRQESLCSGSQCICLTSDMPAEVLYSRRSGSMHLIRVRLGSS